MSTASLGGKPLWFFHNRFGFEKTALVFSLHQEDMQKIAAALGAEFVQAIRFPDGTTFK